VNVDVDGMTTVAGGGGRGTKYLESKLSRDQFGMPWERIQVSAYVHEWRIRSSWW
jgi:hypothetical protein